MSENKSCGCQNCGPSCNCAAQGRTPNAGECCCGANERILNDKLLPRLQTRHGFNHVLSTFPRRQTRHGFGPAFPPADAIRVRHFFPPPADGAQARIRQ